MIVKSNCDANDAAFDAYDAFDGALFMIMTSNCHIDNGALHCTPMLMVMTTIVMLVMLLMVMDGVPSTPLEFFS